MKAIVAMSANGVIGVENKIPWHIPEDLKWFKSITMGHSVLMGRKTFDSIGKLLPGRKNIVLSRCAGSSPGVTYITKLDDLELHNDINRDLFVIGGGEVYSLTMDMWTDLYVTHVYRKIEGNVFFPKFESYFNDIGTVLFSDRFKIVHYRSKKCLET